MSCRQKYTLEIRQDILDSYGVDKTSAQLIKPNQILLPINEKHKTKESTLEWANRVAKELYTKYNSQAYGPVVKVDNNTNPTGTIVDIIIPSKLIDGYERKYGTQEKLFQLDTTVNKKNDLIDNIYKGLEEYIKINNINIEFLESLKRDNLDPIAIFNIINNTIKINISKADKTTLPEELGHHIVEALGDNYTLVKRALNLISKTNYIEELGPEYIEVYNNNTDLLRKEYLGKLISKTIVNNFENKDKVNETLWDTIKRLIDSFIKLFNPNSNIFNNLQNDVDELSKIIITGKKVYNDFSLIPNKPSQDFYSLSKKNKPKVSIEYQKQYEFFKESIKKSERLNSKYIKQIQEKGPNKELLDNIKYNNERITKVQSTLAELLESNNKQLLVDLSNETLDTIESYISNLESQDIEKLNIDNIEHIRDTLNIFKEFSGTRERSNDLYKRLRPFITKYALDVVNKYSSNTIIQEDIIQNNKDIFSGVKNFGTLVDIKNYLGKTIGELIKNAQNTISTNNKKSYDELKVEVNALEEYYKTKGVTGNNIYKIFIQPYRNTTVLTKEFTKEFYEEINNSFKLDLEEGKRVRRNLAFYDNSRSKNDNWIPKDKSKYINKDYKQIQDTKELKRFYDYFKKTINDITDKLPIGDSLDPNFIPNVVEQSLMDIFKSDKALMSKMKEGISNITGIYSSEQDDNAYLVDENLFKDEIPLKFITNLDPSIKSKNLEVSLLKFMYFANSYVEMSEILPKTKLLQDEIKSNKFISNSRKPKDIKGENTNIYKMADKFIDMQVLGKMKFDEKYAPYIDLGLKHTSFLFIGLNPFNAVSNVGIGFINNFIEASGGRFYTLKEFNKANNIYFSTIMNEESKNKIHKIIGLLNPLMELEDYQNLEDIKVDNSIYKEKFKSIMYLPQSAGEKYLQTTTMIANMLHDKIESKDGSKISIWNAFDEVGNWKTEEFGKLTEDTIYRMSNKTQRINQMIHGRYSSKDAAILNQYAIFRMAFQFKKWIPSALEVRLGSKRFDDRLGYEIEGRYNTYWKGIMYSIRRLQNDKEKLESLKFTENDIYNMKRNLMELITLLVVSLSYFLLGKAGDDDKQLKKNTLYKFTMNQLDRISSDLVFFYNPKDISSSLEKGLPMLRSINTTIKVFENLPHIFGTDKDDIYTKGIRKGENKFNASLKDAIPIIKPITDVVRTFKKDVAYEKPYKK